MLLHAFGKVGRPVGARIGSFRSVARVCCTQALEVLAAMGFLSLSIPAKAQQAAPLPAYDPRQIERRLETQSPPAPASRPPIRLPQLGQGEQRIASRGPQFELRQVIVTGAHAISAEAIAGVYRPYLGRRVPLAAVADIAVKIGDLYREAGFHLSRAIVPPQDIRNGCVHIEVIEGAISELVLQGHDVERFGIRAYLDDVLQERPSRLSTLERKMMLINNLPGVRIEDSSIEEIGRATGKFRLIVRLNTWRVFMALATDNLGSAAVGPWQSYATLALNSAFQPGDVLTGNYSTVPTDPRELSFGRLAYDVPVGADGVRVGASAILSEVRPGDIRRLSDDVTRTQSFELRGGFVPWESQLSTLTLSATFGFTDVSEGDMFGPIYNDHIRTLALVADYRLQDALGGIDYLTLMAKQGLGIFGASHPGDDLLSRDGASGEFSAFGFWATRYQPLADAWSLKFAAAGQFAAQPLLLSQQFYLGGASFGRAYDSAEVSGDNGLAGSLELRFQQSLNNPLFKSYELYSFLESGVVWNNGTALIDGLSLTSAGGGIRVNLANDLQAGAGVAFPLTYRSPTNENHSPRFLFSLSSALKFCPTGARLACS
jgi:hemolysin activation/secretion protein